MELERDRDEGGGGGRRGREGREGKREREGDIGREGRNVEGGQEGTGRRRREGGGEGGESGGRSGGQSEALVRLNQAKSRSFEKPPEASRSLLQKLREARSLSRSASFLSRASRRCWCASSCVMKDTELEKP